MPIDLRHINGPIDIIGDIHGCAEELQELLVKLGHAQQTSTGSIELIQHPEGRHVCLLGDLTDHGPDNLSSIKLAKVLQEDFGAIIVMGNHDERLAAWLRGLDTRISHGLHTTVACLSSLTTEERERYADWLESLPPHCVLDSGSLIVAHAGLKEEFHGIDSDESRACALYGKKTGETDRHGIPTSVDWAADYRGKALVVHGHVVTREPRRLNNVISIDNGCVFGGKLTAYRYPEDTFVSVTAKANHGNGVLPDPEPTNMQEAA
ncbi:metallophosphoesterase [Erythrobacter aureus]|nr:metallophosphoesterase [Erythrobacter aureus]